MSFQSSCTLLHFHQQFVKVSMSLHFHQHLLLSIFFIMAILVGVKWYFTMVLIFHFLMANNTKHLLICMYWPFVYFFSQHVSSLKQKKLFLKKILISDIWHDRLDIWSSQSGVSVVACDLYSALLMQIKHRADFFFFFLADTSHSLRLSLWSADYPRSFCH